LNTVDLKEEDRLEHTKGTDSLDSKKFLHNHQPSVGQILSIGSYRDFFAALSPWINSTKERHYFNF
jgi:hypothetical protein